METSSRTSLTNVSGGLPIVPTRLPKKGNIKMTWLLVGVRRRSAACRRHRSQLRAQNLKE